MFDHSMHDMICRQIEAAHHTSTTSNDRKERNIQWHTSENAAPSGITPSRSAARPASVRKSLAALHAKKPRQPMLVLLSRSKSTAATSNQRRRRSRSFSRSGSPTMWVSTRTRILSAPIAPSLRITFALPSATASFTPSVRRCSNNS